MNTILQCLEMLPEPYRSQAIKNHKMEPYFASDTLASGPADALNMAFLWYISPEGYSYWGVVHDKLFNGEPLTEHPSHGIEPGQVWWRKALHDKDPKVYTQCERLILGVTEEMVYCRLPQGAFIYRPIEEFIENYELLQP